ncbi:hypothetical protein D3C79_603330 [compost metagenome]
MRRCGVASSTRTAATPNVNSREKSGQNARPTSHTDQTTDAANTSRYTTAPGNRCRIRNRPLTNSPAPANAKYHDPPSTTRYPPPTSSAKPTSKTTIPRMISSAAVNLEVLDDGMDLGSFQMMFRQSLTMTSTRLKSEVWGFVVRRQVYVVAITSAHDESAVHRDGLASDVA